MNLPGYDAQETVERIACIHGNYVNRPCTQCALANLALQTPEVERVAWIILSALHKHVPEDERPMSWSDMRDEQELRIREAARDVLTLLQPNLDGERRHWRAMGSGECGRKWRDPDDAMREEGR